MANEPQSVESPTLSATVERCLTRLQSLSLALDTYGNEDHAVLRMRLSHNSRRLFPPNQLRRRTQWTLS
jgi:hypothetical protein